MSDSDLEFHPLNYENCILGTHTDTDEVSSTSDESEISEYFTLPEYGGTKSSDEIDITDSEFVSFGKSINVDPESLAQASLNLQDIFYFISGTINKIEKFLNKFEEGPNTEWLKNQLLLIKIALNKQNILQNINNFKEVHKNNTVASAKTRTNGTIKKKNLHNQKQHQNSHELFQLKPNLEEPMRRSTPQELEQDFLETAVRSRPVSTSPNAKKQRVTFNSLSKGTTLNTHNETSKDLVCAKITQFLGALQEREGSNQVNLPKLNNRQTRKLNSTSATQGGSSSRSKKLIFPMSNNTNRRKTSPAKKIQRRNTGNSNIHLDSSASKNNLNIQPESSLIRSKPNVQPDSFSAESKSNIQSGGSSSRSKSSYTSNPLEDKTNDVFDNILSKPNRITKRKIIPVKLTPSTREKMNSCVHKIKPKNCKRNIDQDICNELESHSTMNNTRRSVRIRNMPKDRVVYCDRVTAMALKLGSSCMPEVTALKKAEKPKKNKVPIFKTKSCAKKNTNTNKSSTSGSSKRKLDQQKNKIQEKPIKNNAPIYKTKSSAKSRTNTNAPAASGSSKRKSNIQTNKIQASTSTNATSNDKCENAARAAKKEVNKTMNTEQKSAVRNARSKSVKSASPLTRKRKLMDFVKRQTLMNNCKRAESEGATLRRAVSLGGRLEQNDNEESNTTDQMHDSSNGSVVKKRKLYSMEKYMSSLSLL